MNSILFLALVFFLSATVLAFASVPGGWSFVDPRDEGVQKAAAFAVRTKYAEKTPQFWVVLAKRQVGTDVLLVMLTQSRTDSSSYTWCQPSLTNSLSLFLYRPTLGRGGSQL